MKTRIYTRLTLTAAVLLTACSPGYESLNYPVLPPELADCKFYRVNDDSGNSVRVVRCPNRTTSTTYSSGKTTTTTVVIDGVEYELKPKASK